MANLYRDSALPAPATSPLSGGARTDIAVVGAGITGLSTALHAAEAGAAVMVLEAEDIGFGASGRNGGQVNPGLKHDPDVVERDFGADLGSRMNVLAGSGPQLVFDLIKRLGIDCEARRNGTLRAAVRAKHAAAVRATAEQWIRRGAPVDVLEGSALERLTGTRRYAAALFDRRGGDLNPLSYVRGLARAAIAAGVRVHGGTRVLRLEPAAERWRLHTPSGTVEAAHVVLATNGYTDSLWPALRRTVVPLFGAVLASEPLSGRARLAVMPSRSVLYESGAITVYYRVDAQGRLILGGRGPMREIDRAAAIPHLAAYAIKLWPQLGGAGWTHAWGGRLAMTSDSYPHIHEPARGVLACLGYNGRGVALATVLGERLARRIAHPTEPFDMPITALAPIPLHALWPLAVKVAIERGRISDHFG